MLSRRLQPLCSALRSAVITHSHRSTAFSIATTSSRLAHTTVHRRSSAATKTSTATHPFNPEYLKHLACPICKQQNLQYRPELNELHSNCTADVVIAYSILPSGVPNMVVDDARRVEPGSADKQQ